MTWKLDATFPGYQPIEAFLPTAALAASGGLVSIAAQWPPVPMGFIARAEDPVWGGGEFIFAKANGTIILHGLCVLTPLWNATTRQFDWNATAVANTANQGRMVAVCMSEQGSVGAVNALTTGQFGWFMITGNQPVNGTATVAAAANVGITAAGQIGAFAAGKQVNNMVSIAAATQTVVVASLTGGVSGGFTIPVANVDGLFVGGYIAGTGVGASSIIQAIDRVGMVITSSVANSAAVTGNVTQTANNATIFYNVVNMNRPFAQGQIT